jgi:hypothetical protein
MRNAGRRTKNSKRTEKILTAKHANGKSQKEELSIYHEGHRGHEGEEKKIFNHGPTRMEVNAERGTQNKKLKTARKNFNRETRKTRERKCRTQNCKKLNSSRRARSASPYLTVNMNICVYPCPSVVANLFLLRGSRGSRLTIFFSS